VHHVKQSTTSEARVQESRPVWLIGEVLFTKDIARPCQGTLGGVSEDVLLHTQLKNVLEVFSFGIVEASLPLADRAAGDSKPLGQASLLQANALAQPQHRLPKGIVVLTIGVPRHGRAPCLPHDPAAAPHQQCEAKGRKMPPAGG
jgi:hypothetical protein